MSETFRAGNSRSRFAFLLDVINNERGEVNFDFGGASDSDGTDDASGTGAGSDHDASGDSAGTDTSKGDLPKWHGVLPKDYQGHDALKDVKGMDELLGKFVALKGFEGKVIVPNKDASDEEKANFYKAIGVPESSDAYSIEKVDIPPETGYSGEIMPEYKKVFHDLKLTQVQANTLFKAHMAMEKAKFDAMQAEQTKQRDAAKDALKTEWKGDFDKNANIANKALRAYTDQDTFASLKKKYPGLTSDPDVVKMFHKIGKETLDDSVISGTSVTQGDRPKDAAGRSTFAYKKG